MLTCSVQSGVVQFCGLVSVFLVRKMGDLALHSALDARLETKKKTYLTLDFATRKPYPCGTISAFFQVVSVATYPSVFQSA